ncbi:MAG: hypothetical protein EDM75_07695 [Chlorobiota bacterium]|nr:MAG: hypothetical protein EDM75_07695 [Chlorobiota bacterium]
MHGNAEALANKNLMISQAHVTTGRKLSSLVIQPLKRKLKNIVWRGIKVKSQFLKYFFHRLLQNIHPGCIFEVQIVLI